MARLARVVVKGVPHHITQRANRGRWLARPEDEEVLDVLRRPGRPPKAKRK